MGQAVTLIVPIAFDMQWSRVGHVALLGRGTMKACDHAAEIALEFPNAELFFSATKAPNYDNVVMGLLMYEYVRHTYPNLARVWHEADDTGTLYEVKAALQYAETAPVERIVFAVKSFHAERVELLAEGISKRHGLTVPIEVRRHTLHRPYPILWARDKFGCLLYRTGIIQIV